MSPKNPERLADRILVALNLAIVQKDLSIAELLNSALEMAMTRNAGGRAFIERREFTIEFEGTLKRLAALRKARDNPS